MKICTSSLISSFVSTLAWTDTAKAFSPRLAVRQIATRTILTSTASDYEKVDGEQRINIKIDLDSPKVANMESLDTREKKVFCRCWLSDTFPMCDGSHVKHNAEFNDNVGPLIVSKPKSSQGEDIKAVDKKVEGRKKRLILGYYATSVTYIVYAARYFNVKGVQPFAVQVASGYTLASGISYILASSVKGNRLSSDTYKRLNLSLMEYGILGCIGWGLVQFGEIVPGFAPLLAAPFLATVNSIKGYAYGVLGVDKTSTASISGDFYHGVISTIKGYFTLPQTFKGAGYLIATWTLTGMKVVKLTEILRLIAEGANGLTIYTRISRFARYAMVSTVLYTLKDAADRGRLEGSTFIELNVLSSGVLAVLAAYLGARNPLGAAAMVFSGFSAFNAVSSTLKNRKS